MRVPGNVLVWLGAALIFVTAPSARPAAAADCPRNLGCGVVGCACGDTVNPSGTTFTMTADITCPTDFSQFAALGGFGLKVKSGKTLDGGLNASTGKPYRLIGPGNPDASHPDTMSDNYGIWLIEGGATVQNVEVTGFRRGVEIRGADSGSLSNGNTVSGVYAHDNGNFLDSNPHGYGVTVVGTSNTLISLVIDHNADEGIHFGSIGGNGNNSLTWSTISNNGRENIYLLDNSQNTISNNTTSHPQSTCIGSGVCLGLYAKHSSSNTITNNIFGGPGASDYDRGVKFTAASNYNFFSDNTLKSSSSYTGRLSVERYDDPGKTYNGESPTGNTFQAGSITNPASYCVAFTNSSGNTYNKLNRNNLASCSYDLAETTGTESNSANYCNPPGPPTTSGSFTLNPVSCP